MKTIFFGSDDFAQAHLKALISSDHDVLACVTQPDRPKGRGMKVVISPIKECAQKHAIPVLQPSSLKEGALIKQLADLACDLFVVIAYGKFLPKEVLDIPPQGAINVHASLLPKYRGAAPINWAIINGEKETGISIIRINEEMDAGDILNQMNIDIDKEETSVTLRAKMIGRGQDFLLKTIDRLDGCASRVQDISGVTFAPKLTKELGRIEWADSAKEINNSIRGLLPWPSAYTDFKKKMLKILEARVLERDLGNSETGMVSEVSKEGIVVSTGKGSLQITKVHLQDSKPMDAHSFILGHDIQPGFKFTS